MNYFLIGNRGLVWVHKNRNISQKSWKLILRTFILQASCATHVIRLIHTPLHSQSVAVTHSKQPIAYSAAFLNSCSTEIGKKSCMWLRDISSCSCLNVLPGFSLHQNLHTILADLCINNRYCYCLQ